MNATVALSLAMLTVGTSPQIYHPKMLELPMRSFERCIIDVRSTQHSAGSVLKIGQQIPPPIAMILERQPLYLLPVVSSEKIPSSDCNMDILKHGTRGLEVTWLPKNSSPPDLTPSRVQPCLERILWRLKPNLVVHLHTFLRPIC